MASKRRKPLKGLKQRPNKRKTHHEGFQAINNPITALMARSRSSSFEYEISADPEQHRDSTSGCQDVTVDRAFSGVLQIESKKVQESPDGAERHQAQPEPAQKQEEKGTQGTEDQQAEDLQAEDLQAEDLQAEDLQAEDLQAEDSQSAGGQKATNENAIQESVAEGHLSQGRGRGEMMTPSADKGQNGPLETDNAVDLETIPEQIRFFDVQFDRSSKEYTVSRLQESVPDWYDLDHESDFTTQDETFRRGDIVHIKLHDQIESKAGDDVACIEDIRALARPDERKLVLVTWLYLADGGYYKSNHLQIVLWDTITRRATQLLARQVHSTQLYNVCGGKKFCSPRQAEAWRERKARAICGPVS